jgi:hypothetical protein
MKAAAWRPFFISGAAISEPRTTKIYWQEIIVVSAKNELP